MADDWSSTAAAYLERTDLCPRCGAALTGMRCASCGADLASAQASEVLRISAEVAALLRRRASAIEAIPVSVALPAAVPVAPVAPAARIVPTPVTASVIVDDELRPQPAEPVQHSSVTLQSVMAVAGAGLIAVAAVVFSYVNPDFTDVGARALVLLGVTALMVAGAAALIRIGLRFSAEAIGALGGVLVALDIQSVAEYTGTDVSPWALGAIGCVIGAALLAGLGILVRLRAWIWYAAAGITLAPALWGYSGSEPAPTLGHLGAIAVSLLAQPVLTLLAVRMGSRLTAVRVTSTVLRFVAILAILVQLTFESYPFDPAVSTLFRAAVIGALAVAAAVGALVQLPRIGVVVAGVLAVASASVAVTAIPLSHGPWVMAIVPAAAGAITVVLAGVPLASRLPRAWLVGAAAISAAAVGAPLLVTLLRIVVAIAGSGTSGDDVPSDDLRYPLGSATVLGFLVLAAGAAALWRLTRRREETEVLARVVLGGGLWIAPLIGIALLVAPELPIDVAVLVSLLPALGSAVLLLQVPRVGEAPVVFRVPLILTAHLLPVVVAPIAVQRGPLVVPLAAATLLVWILASLTVPRRVRVVHWIAGNVYALVALGAALSASGIGLGVAAPIVAISSAALALVLTRIRRIAADLWLGSLAVAIVPFLGAVALVLNVRTGWTAGSALAGAVLAAALVLGRRPGLGIVVRTISAALVVPSVAVALVCLGAQVLEVSASPIVLPVVAGLVALALPATGGAVRLLSARGIADDQSRAARLAIEASALVTGAVAVLLALVRVAAGPETAFAVLVVIGIGSVATGLFARRRYGWIVAFWSFSGALWTFLGPAGVVEPEAYVLPPTLVAAVVGSALVARRTLVGPSRALVAVGLAIAPLPSIGVLVVAEAGAASVVPRVVGLLVGSAVLLLAGAVLVRAGSTQDPGGRGIARLLPIRSALLGAAILAAVGGPLEGVRVGLWSDPTGLGRVPDVVWPALALSASGALLAALAGLLLARVRPPVLDSGIGRRWVLVPALVFLVAGPIASTHRGWAPIWLLWTLAVLLLALLVVVSVRAARRATVLPPVWVLFAIAWVTAVAGWSMRDLRVEVFSLPLGLALLAAGVVGMRSTAPESSERRATFDSWPNGFSGSWRLLAPGIVVTLLPSMLATGTDPQTWRAITVLALALAAILIGSLRKLAAPFLLGIAVLPIENLIVFGAQLGRSISATSWWISLATAGAVLLVIAVTSERRSGGGIAARLRDLR